MTKEKQETLKLIKKVVITKATVDHCLTHLQNIEQCLQDTPDIQQAMFNVYELGQHLGFSPFEINKEKI